MSAPLKVKVRRSIAVAIAGLALVPSTVEATCGSAQCFLDTGSGEGLQTKGSFLVDLSYQSVNQSKKLAGSAGTAEVLTPKIDFETQTIEPEHHREIRTENTLVRLSFAYGVTDRLSVFALLPLVNDRDHDHFDDVGEPDESFTNADGSSGFGDARVGARYGLLVKKKDVVFGDLTIKLPTGSYRQLDSEGSVNEPTIQPGTGSTDLIARLRWSRAIRPGALDVFVSGSYRLNTENNLDYRFGDEALVISGFEHRFAPRWAWSLQLSARRTARDRYLGADVASTGITFVDLSPGLRFDTGSGLAIYGYYEWPAYQHVNDAQLAPRSGILIGISKTF